MKKFICLFIIMLLCTVILGCYKNSFSIQQSTDNFQKYCGALQQVTDKYGLNLTANTESAIEDHDHYKDLRIQIDLNSYIKIRMINSATDADKGSESFSVDYFLHNSDVMPESNIKLFVELANCISGKEISYDLCSNFLNAPESEYAAKDYGYQKENGEVVAKMYPLNFWEDWVLCYFETLDKKQLSFGGLTKNNID